MTQHERDAVLWQVEEGKRIIDAMLEHGVGAYNNGIIVRRDKLDCLRDRFEQIEYVMTYGKSGNGPGT